MPVVAPKLVSFDLDGTLFPDTTSGTELARLLGHLNQMRDLEDRYARFEISNADVARADAQAYSGRSVAELQEAVLTIPIISGFQETVHYLKTYNIHLLIVTLAWSFVARALVKKYGLDECAGAVLGESNGRFTGKVEQDFEDVDKPLFVRAYAEQRGFSMAQCVAIGDSRSDIPLFREVGVAIALNATEQAKDKANFSLDTRDLTEVLPLLID